MLEVGIISRVYVCDADRTGSAGAQKASRLEDMCLTPADWRFGPSHEEERFVCTKHAPTGVPLRAVPIVPVAVTKRERALASAAKRERGR